MKRTNFPVKANASADHPITEDGVIYTTGEHVVGFTNQTISEAVLKELQIEYTDVDIANTFLRQLKQDEANAVRTDWRTGGAREERVAVVETLAERAAKGGEDGARAVAEMAQMLLKPRKHRK